MLAAALLSRVVALSVKSCFAVSVLPTSVIAFLALMLTLLPVIDDVRAVVPPEFEIAVSFWFLKP